MVIWSAGGAFFSVPCLECRVLNAVVNAFSAEADFEKDSWGCFILILVMFEPYSLHSVLYIVVNVWFRCARIFFLSFRNFSNECALYCLISYIFYCFNLQNIIFWLSCASKLQIKLVYHTVCCFLFTASWLLESEIKLSLGCEFFHIYKSLSIAPIVD